MTAKIVYYGPGLCGKTTNLLVIFDKLDEKSRGKMLSLATKTDRTLFFDLLPVDIGKVGAFNLKIQLYTVPGQVFYNETRKLVLKGADAVVFVADSQPSMVESTRESFENLVENLTENNIDPNEIPIIIQYNKRDIPGVLSVEELQERLSFEGYPYTEAVAIQGEGVMETFKLATKITAKHLITKLQGKPSSRPEPVREEKKKSKIERQREKEPPPPSFDSNTAANETVALSSNPFADSMPTHDTPMSAPFEAGGAGEYEKVEEVSLESLLEGRDRPATMSGNIPIPVEMDEVIEELPASDMVDSEEPLSLGFEEPPAEIDEAPYDEPEAETEIKPEPVAASSELSSAEVSELRGEINVLRAEIADLKRDHERLKEGMRGAFAALAHTIGSES
ncbi:MAG TPA: GTPase domain-containing protein [Thermoanaerobaculia bacterium]|nr:GTPase domain-containing protein [Thermoanaerobaculia bacterium]